VKQSEYKFLKNANTIRRGLVRRARAKELGVSFFRSPSFKTPESILMKGMRVPLLFPEEKGIRFAFIDIFLDDVYGLRNATGQYTSILDVGANVGFFTLYARIRFPNSVIHSYEPNIQLARFLNHQASLAKARVFLEAVGEENGMINLIPGRESLQTRSVLDARGKIPQIAFAEAVRRIGGKADLVKLDCEGAEWSILRDRKAWENVGHLAMEYHLFEPHQRHDEISRMVETAGFQIDFQKKEATGGYLFASNKA